MVLARRPLSSEIAEIQFLLRKSQVAVLAEALRPSLVSSIVSNPAPLRLYLSHFFKSLMLPHCFQGLLRPCHLPPPPPSRAALQCSLQDLQHRYPRATISTTTRRGGSRRGGSRRGDSSRLRPSESRFSSSSDSNGTSVASSEPPSALPSSSANDHSLSKSISVRGGLSRFSMSRRPHSTGYVTETSLSSHTHGISDTQYGNYTSVTTSRPPISTPDNTSQFSHTPSANKETTLKPISSTPQINETSRSNDSPIPSSTDTTKVGAKKVAAGDFGHVSDGFSENLYWDDLQDNFPKSCGCDAKNDNSKDQVFAQSGTSCTRLRLKKWPLPTNGPKAWFNARRRESTAY